MPSISYLGSDGTEAIFGTNTVVNVDTMPTDGWITNILIYNCAIDAGQTVATKHIIYQGNDRRFVSAQFTKGDDCANSAQSSCNVDMAAGATVKWGVGMSAATGGSWSGYRYDTTSGHSVGRQSGANAPATYAQTESIGSRAIRGTLTYVANATPLTPTMVAPSVGATGVGLTPTFQGTNLHSSLDSAYDSTDQVNLQIRRASDSVVVSDTNFTPSTTSAGATWSKVSPITLTGGISYEWRIRHSDSFGLWSGYSAWRTFTTLQGPAAPTPVAPTGKINVINTFNYQYVYSHPTPLNANAIQILVKNANGSTLYHDSGTVAVSTANGGTATVAEWHADLFWGTPYSHQARFRDTNNTWGPYSDRLAFQTDAPPNPPTNLSPTGGVSTGTTTLTCNLSDPDGDVVTLAQVEIVNVSTGAVLAGYPKSMTVDTVAGTASFNASADLTLGVQYKWRARANDNLGPGYGAYSAYSYFTYVAAPTVALLSPASTRTNLVAQPSAEYDPAGLSTYWTETARTGTDFVDRVVDPDSAYGEAAWQGTGSVSGDNRFRNPLTDIDATKPYLFQVMMKKYSGTSATHFAIDCYNSSSVYVGTVSPTSILAASGANVASVWTRYGGIVWPIGSGNTPAFPAATAKFRIVLTPSRFSAAVVRADAFFVSQIPATPASAADWLTLQPWYGYGDPDVGGYGVGGYTWTGTEGDSTSTNISVLTAPAQNVLISYAGGTGAKTGDRLYIQRWTGTVWASHYDSGWSTTTTRTLIPVPSSIFSSEGRYRVRVEARDTSLVVGTSAWSEVDVRFEGPPEPVIVGASSDPINARVSLQYSLTNAPTEIEFAGVELQRIALDATEDTQTIEVNTANTATSIYDHFPLSGVNYLYRIRQVKQDGANRIQGRWASIAMTVDYSPFSFIKDAEDPFNLAQFETRVENVSAPEEDAPLSSILAWGQTTYAHDVGLARLRAGEVVAEFYSDAGVYGVPDHIARYNTLRGMVTGILSPGQKPSRRAICILIRNPDPERIFAVPVGPVQREFDPPVGVTKRIRFSYQETGWVEDWYIRNGWS